MTSRRKVAAGAPGHVHSGVEGCWAAARTGRFGTRPVASTAGRGGRYERHRSDSPRDGLSDRSGSPSSDGSGRRSRSRSRERLHAEDHGPVLRSPRSCLPQGVALGDVLTLPVLQGVPAGADTSPMGALMGVPVFPVKPDMATFQDEVEEAWGALTHADPFLLELEALSTWQPS